MGPVTECGCHNFGLYPASAVILCQGTSCTVSTYFISSSRRPIGLLLLLLGLTLCMQLVLVLAEALQRPLPLAVRRRPPAAPPAGHGPRRAAVPVHRAGRRRHRSRLLVVVWFGEHTEAVLLGRLHGVLLRLRTPTDASTKSLREGTFQKQISLNSFDVVRWLIQRAHR